MEMRQSRIGHAIEEIVGEQRRKVEERIRRRRRRSEAEGEGEVLGVEGIGRMV
jgi:hypothetical protein